MFPNTNPHSSSQKRDIGGGRYDVNCEHSPAAVGFFFQIV